ncbi:MAG: NCS2 family permease [Treponema sp.]|jgi:AGZA family xanthine/uracil permease-like MFS transporter|nr:NCS2 family permease [Treponema sp.]
MERIFHLQERGTTVGRELVAGVVTFFTMSYILAANPGMLGGIGEGITPGAVFTATAIASAIATLFMALAANLPVALAPNLGLSAFFTYTVVFEWGYSWQAALTAVLIQGILFIIISVTGIRKLIINAIPLNLKKAITVGIGFQIAYTGLENAGVISGDLASLSLGITSNPSAIVTIIGLLITIALYSKHVPGAILLGIIGTALVAIPIGGTIFPEGFTFFRLPEAPVSFQFDFSAITDWKFFVVVFTFLFLDVFNTVGALVGVTAQAGFIKEDVGEGEIRRSLPAFLAAAVGSVVGALLGTSPVSAYVESGAGVGTGGRTGLSSVFTGLLFIAALFMSPLFLMVPSYAMAPAMVMVGILLMWKVTEIDFTYATEAIPAILTIAMMPFTSSIAEGIVYGLLSFVLIKSLTGKGKYVPVATWIISAVFIIRFFIH